MKRLALLTGVLVFAGFGCATTRPKPPQALMDSFVKSPGTPKPRPIQRGDVQVVRAGMMDSREDLSQPEVNASVCLLPTDIKPIGGAAAIPVNTWSKAQIQTMARQVGANLVVYGVSLGPEVPDQELVEKTFSYTARSGIHDTSGSFTLRYHVPSTSRQQTYKFMFFNGTIPPERLQPWPWLTMTEKTQRFKHAAVDKVFGGIQWDNLQNTWAGSMRLKSSFTPIPRSHTNLVKVQPASWKQAKRRYQKTMNEIGWAVQRSQHPRLQELRKLGRAYGASDILWTKVKENHVARMYRPKVNRHHSN